MPPALRTSDLPQHQVKDLAAKLATKRSQAVATARAMYEDKRFDELSPADQANLLKIVAIHLGLILPDV